MWSDDDLVMLSALEHFSYCPRQCGLIHVEKVYDENVFTLRGMQSHQRVHSAEATEKAEGVRIERGLPLWNDCLGIHGVADVVEFHRDGSVYPVEYKSGPRRERRHDDLQLCAQALCLEEMLGIAVPLGAIFSVQSRRRREVDLDDALRRETEETIVHVREMLHSDRLPAPVNDARCPNCSLLDACLPAPVRLGQSMDAALFRIRPGEDEDPPEPRPKRRKE